MLSGTHQNDPAFNQLVAELRSHAAQQEAGNPSAQLLSKAAAAMAQLQQEVEDLQAAKENGMNLMKPSAWATRENKYKKDLQELRRVICQHEEDAARMKEELQAASSGTLVEVLRANVKALEKQVAEHKAARAELNNVLQELNSHTQTLLSLSPVLGPVWKDICAGKRVIHNPLATPRGRGNDHVLDSKQTVSDSSVPAANSDGGSLPGAVASQYNASSSGDVSSMPVNPSISIEHLSVSAAKAKIQAQLLAAGGHSLPHPSAGSGSPHVLRSVLTSTTGAFERGSAGGRSAHADSGAASRAASRRHSAVGTPLTTGMLDNPFSSIDVAPTHSLPTHPEAAAIIDAEDLSKLPDLAAAAAPCAQDGSKQDSLNVPSLHLETVLMPDLATPAATARSTQATSPFSQVDAAAQVVMEMATKDAGTCMDKTAAVETGTHMDAAGHVDIGTRTHPAATVDAATTMQVPGTVDAATNVEVPGTADAATNVEVPGTADAASGTCPLRLSDAGTLTEPADMADAATHTEAAAMADAATDTPVVRVSDAGTQPEHAVRVSDAGTQLEMVAVADSATQSDPAAPAPVLIESSTQADEQLLGHAAQHVDAAMQCEAAEQRHSGTQVVVEQQNAEVQAALLPEQQSAQVQADVLPDMKSAEVQATILPDTQCAEVQAVIVPDIQSAEVQVDIAPEAVSTADVGVQSQPDTVDVAVQLAPGQPPLVTAGVQASVNQQDAEVDACCQVTLMEVGIQASRPPVEVLHTSTSVTGLLALAEAEQKQDAQARQAAMSAAVAASSAELTSALQSAAQWEQTAGVAQSELETARAAESRLTAEVSSLQQQLQQEHAAKEQQEDGLQGQTSAAQAAPSTERDLNEVKAAGAVGPINASKLQEELQTQLAAVQQELDDAKAAAARAAKELSQAQAELACVQEQLAAAQKEEQRLQLESQAYEQTVRNLRVAIEQVDMEKATQEAQNMELASRLAQLQEFTHYQELTPKSVTRSFSSWLRRQPSLYQSNGHSTSGPVEEDESADEGRREYPTY